MFVEKQKLNTVVILLLLIVGLLQCIWVLSTSVRFLWLMPVTSDATVYWVLGRSILEGFTPYLDYYDTKPPGIHYLSALSFGLTGGPILGYIFEMICVIGIAMLAGYFALRSREHFFSLLVFWIFVVVVFLYGCVLAQYAFWTWEGYKVETYGAFFACLYVVLIATSVLPLSRIKMLVMSGAMALSIAFKEPYILIMLASCLLFCDSRKKFIQFFVLPACIALLLGSIIMMLFGIFVPYISLYLPETFFNYTLESTLIDEHAPFLLRGLNFFHIFFHAFTFSPWFLASVLALFVVYVYVSIVLVPDKKYQRIFVLVCGVYLVSLAVQLSDLDFFHYHAQAVPFYFALFCITTSGLLQLKNVQHRKDIACFFVVMIFGAVFSMPEKNVQAEIPRRLNHYRRLEREAKYIDAIMDACSIDRYLFLGMNRKHNTPYALTQHLPYGPAPVQHPRPVVNGLQYYNDEFRNALQKTQLIVESRSEFEDDMKEYVDTYIQTNFTEEPWDCAKSVKRKKPKYQFYYRKEVQ